MYICTWMDICVCVCRHSWGFLTIKQKESRLAHPSISIKNKKICNLTFCICTISQMIDVCFTIIWNSNTAVITRMKICREMIDSVESGSLFSWWICFLYLLCFCFRLKIKQSISEEQEYMQNQLSLSPKFQMISVWKCIPSMECYICHSQTTTRHW